MNRATVISNLLGHPYDDAVHHCWWLASLVQRDVFGRDLPGWTGARPAPAARTRIFRGHPARSSWQAFPEPCDGDLVLMGKAGGLETHCGVYLGDFAGIIHSDKPHGVVIDTLPEIRVAGWAHLSFNRPI